MSNLLWHKEGVAVDAEIQRFLAGDDVVLDREFIAFDLQASRAHAEGLARIGLLTGAERDALLAGLAQLADEVERGVFVLARTSNPEGGELQRPQRRGAARGAYGIRGLA